MDVNREVRAMILCVLPFPPLPVQASRFEDGNVVGDNLVTTSHDILSHLLEEACVKRTSDENQRRSEQQLKVLEDFYMEMQKASTLTAEELYGLYCTYTKRHIATYLENTQVPELLFMPLAYCCKADATHKRMCDYMAGQAVMKQLPQKEWSQMEYSVLLQEARDSFLVNDLL